MPSGFDNILFAGTSANPNGLTENCYFCTVAALSNMRVNALVAKIGIMQDRYAQLPEISELFNSAGHPCKYYSGLDVNDVAYWINNNINFGESIGLAFNRLDGSGHMIVVTKDMGYIASHYYPNLKCVDYQANPPQITTFPPEGGIGFIYHLFFRS